MALFKKSLLKNNSICNIFISYFFFIKTLHYCLNQSKMKNNYSLLLNN